MNQQALVRCIALALVCAPATTVWAQQSQTPIVPSQSLTPQPQSQSQSQPQSQPQSRTPNKRENQAVISRVPFQIEESAATGGGGNAVGQERLLRPSEPPANIPPSAGFTPLEPRAEGGTGFGTPKSGSSGQGGMLTTVISSLAIVLGVFFLVVWISRRGTPNGFAHLPSDVVASLGRAPLFGRQQMQLIRIGNKLVLLSVSAQGAEPLTEVTDPGEVDRLAGLCQQNQPGSITATFRQVLSQHGSEAPARSQARET